MYLTVVCIQVFVVANINEFPKLVGNVDDKVFLNSCFGQLRYYPTESDREPVSQADELLGRFTNRRSPLPGANVSSRAAVPSHVHIERDPTYVILVIAVTIAIVVIVVIFHSYSICTTSLFIHRFTASLYDAI